MSSLAQNRDAWSSVSRRKVLCRIVPWCCHMWRSSEIYDSATGTFQTAGELLVARDSHSATLLPNGMVLVAGGYTHDFDGDANPEWYTMFTAELFDPATSVSTSAASLEGDRAEHVATMLNNG